MSRSVVHTNLTNLPCFTAKPGDKYGIQLSMTEEDIDNQVKELTTPGSIFSNKQGSELI